VTFSHLNSQYTSQEAKELAATVLENVGDRHGDKVAIAPAEILGVTQGFEPHVLTVHIRGQKSRQITDEAFGGEATATDRILENYHAYQESTKTD